MIKEQTEKKPQRLSQIEVQIEDINKAVIEIHEKINQLNDQLFKILLPSTLDIEKEKECIEPFYVPLAKELIIISTSIRGAIERLQDTINRIDI